MDRTQLGRSLKEHFFEEGQFSPFAYSIGLECSVQESAEATQAYPIPEPVSDETLAQFLRSLTFFHEAIHLCQYISTSFGLRTLRFTNILLSRLSKGKRWKLPIAQSLLDRLEELSPEEGNCYEACLLFLDAMYQVQLDHSARPTEPGDIETGITVEFLPWSPHLFQVEQENPEAREKYVEALRGAGIHLRKLPRLRAVHSKGAYQIVLNAAALVEGYAIIGELNHIHNALNLFPDEAIALLPPGNEYHVLLTYLLQDGLCSWDVLMPTLAICIDAALMYDPFVLFNVPWDVADAQGRYDQYPGETFPVGM